MKKEILAGKEYIVENDLYYPINKESIFEKMGGAYRLVEIDKEYNVEVLLPDIEFEEIDTGKLNSIGRARLKFLQDYDNDKYLVLIATGELMSHLLSIQEEAEQMRENMLPSMKKEWGLTEQLKIDNQMKWVGLMNNLEATIKEIILNDLVYV